jgi:hypothetical protein
MPAPANAAWLKDVATRATSSTAKLGASPHARFPATNSVINANSSRLRGTRAGHVAVLAPALQTMCDNVYMSVNVSVRLDDALAERLRMRARAAGESLSDRLRRYAEEGARRDEHPLITFRDGPTGRRAGLVGGPDVWEVSMWVEDLADEPDPAAALVADGVVTRAQIDAALRYRAAYPDEIAARIELHRRETAAAGAR